jgi:hypothetical protein
MSKKKKAPVEGEQMLRYVFTTCSNLETSLRPLIEQAESMRAQMEDCQATTILLWDAADLPRELRDAWRHAKDGAKQAAEELQEWKAKTTAARAGGK